VRVTIRYRHPERPDEAGMTMIANQTWAQATVEQLEWQGCFLVEKVTVAQSTSARAAAEPRLDWPLSNSDRNRLI
jgi:hypothetical protein